MTHTQVQYWNYVEGKRHNLVMERQNQRNINETIRHNFVTEGISRGNLSETIRHDKVVEAQGDRKLGIEQQNADTNTFNAQTNRINAQTNQYNAETNRINARTNQFNAQTNRMNAVTNQGMLKVAQENASINRYNAQTQRLLANSTVQVNTAKIENLGYVNDKLTTEIRLNQQKYDKEQLLIQNQETINDITKLERNQAQVDWDIRQFNYGLELYSSPIATLSKNLQGGAKAAGQFYGAYKAAQVAGGL